MSLTAANAVIMLSIPLVFPTPVQLQGFAADDIFSTEALDSAEVQMGVDGVMSAGFVFVPVQQRFVLQADSASNFIFDTWYNVQQGAKELFFATGLITLTSVGLKFAMVKGALTSYMPLPDAKKILQPRSFGITWQSAASAPS